MSDQEQIEALRAQVMKLEAQRELLLEIVNAQPSTVAVLERIEVLLMRVTQGGEAMLIEHCS